MRYEHRGKDIPIAPPGCPAVKWDNLDTPTLPNFPVDLTGEVSGNYSHESPPCVSKFSMLSEALDNDPTRVQVYAEFDAGCYPSLVTDSPDTEPHISMRTINVIVPSLVLPEGSDLVRIAEAVENNPQAESKVGEWLGERVMDCPGVTADGQCGALGGSALEDVLNRAAQEFSFNPQENI
jgi:hypothetical protein